MAEQYDLTPQEQANLIRKAELRAVERQEFLRQIHNPYRHALNIGGTVNDKGMLRFQAMKSTGYDHFRPTPKTSKYGLALIVVPMLLYGYLLKTERSGRENLYRTGQVAYKDRTFKFI